MSPVTDARPTGASRTVGLIGLGAMGRGVAANLMAKGFAVLGRDIDAKALAWLREHGGRVADDAAALAAGADIVLSFLVDDRQTEAVLFGEDALAPKLSRGTTVIVCSTMPPRYVRELGERLSALGLNLVDAPVTGGKVGAEAGTLTVMAAGAEGPLAEARPVLECFGRRVYVLGDTPGQGAQMKVVNQLLCGVHIVAAAEALALARRHGLPLETTLEILRSGSASSWMLGDRGPRMVREAFDDVTSAVDIFVKDLGLVLEAARESKVATPVASAAFLGFLEASGAGMGRLDDSAVVRNYTDAFTDAIRRHG